MATLVKIKGLERNASGLARGFRVPQGLGQQFPAGVKASLTPTTNSVTFTAKYGGTQGNAIRVATAVGALGIAVAYTAATGAPTITVTAPADATVAGNTALINAVNAHVEAGQFVTASLNGTGAAANAAVAAANLAGGTNVGSGQPINRVVNSGSLVVVDVDDAQTARALVRAKGRYISLGQA